MPKPLHGYSAHLGQGLDLVPRRLGLTRQPFPNRLVGDWLIMEQVELNGQLGGSVYPMGQSADGLA